MLTSRQQELLDYLRGQQRTNGVMPSTREIQAHFGFASQTAAVSHLRALERKGVIRRLAGKARAVIFPDSVDRDLQLRDVPIFGTIPAGLPEGTAPEPDGVISLDPKSMGLGKHASTFALRVRGLSMKDAAILPGDLVIMEAKEPRDGDIVAALIDGETTLKRFTYKNGRPYLRAENADFKDMMPAQELLIQGVMTGLIRREVARAA